MCEATHLGMQVLTHTHTHFSTHMHAHTLSISHAHMHASIHNTNDLIYKACSMVLCEGPHSSHYTISDVVVSTILAI